MRRAGRWSYRSRSFASAGRNLYARARAEKSRQVSASMGRYGARRSDQAALWESIGRTAACLRVSSSTGAMADIYEQQAESLGEYAQAFAAAPGQLGAVFVVGGEVRGLELFGSAGMFAKYLDKLIGSYALDAVGELPPHRRRRGGADQVRGDETQDQVAYFIEAVQQAVARSYPGVDEGEDVRLESEAVAGGALVKDERVVHLAAFAAPARAGREEADAA